MKHYPKAALGALVLLAAIPRNLSAEEIKIPGIPIPAVSPDGRLVFRLLDDQESEFAKRDPGYTLAVVETKAGHPIFILPETVSVAASHVEDVHVVWSKDSTRLAINYVAGGGYETTSLFRRDGKTFREMPDPEAVLSEYPAKEKLRQIQKLGLPANTCQRRISDIFSTRRWIDDDAIEADAFSQASIVFKGAEGDDLNYVEGLFRIVAKFDSQSGQWRVVKSVKKPWRSM